MPRLSFALESGRPGEALAQARIRVGEWDRTTTRQVAITYDGPLAPHTDYPVLVTATGRSGQVAEATGSFRTGRMGTPWQAKWITDLAFDVADGTSPVPMGFRRRFPTRGPYVAPGPRPPRSGSTSWR